MENIAILLIGGALAGVAVLFVVAQVVQRKLQAMWPAILDAISLWVDEEILKSIDVVAMVKELDVETEINTLLDERFGDMLAALKVAFPMVSMFLNEGVEILLKRQAKEQLAKILPELKDRMAERVKEKVDLKALVGQKLDNLTFDQVWPLVKPTVKKAVLPLYGIAAAVGILFGAIEYFFL